MHDLILHSILVLDPWKDLIGRSAYDHSALMSALRGIYCRTDVFLVFMRHASSIKPRAKETDNENENDFSHDQQSEDGLTSKVACSKNALTMMHAI